MALGSATQALSTTAAALANHPCRFVTITNNDASISMLLGNSASQSLTLKPATSITFPINNTNKIYAKSASGTPTLSYMWE